jgi:hypothetical protein
MSSTKVTPSALVLDEKAFRQKIPYSLNPTNLTGAFSSPAPADSFDPNQASAVDLVKQGLLWRRPAATDNPALVNALRDHLLKFWKPRWL